MSDLAPKPIHILLVEDDPDHADLIQLGFEATALDSLFTHVEDGEQALAYLKGQPPHTDRPTPDLILLDLNLPKLTGHEVLAEIRSDEKLRTIPVVVLTTSNAASDRSLAYNHHANSYIVKPLEPEGFNRMTADLHDYWVNWNKFPETNAC
ncbi:MAG: response regulator [Planctomycetota bacterium]|jgi:CheY-like chemotaxis protein